MTDVQQLDEFHQFALERLNQSKVNVELGDLLLEWYDSKDSKQINETIREGLA